MKRRPISFPRTRICSLRLFVGIVAALVTLAGVAGHADEQVVRWDIIRFVSRACRQSRRRGSSRRRRNAIRAPKPHDQDDRVGYFQVQEGQGRTARYWWRNLDDYYGFQT